MLMLFLNLQWERNVNLILEGIPNLRTIIIEALYRYIIDTFSSKSKMRLSRKMIMQIIIDHNLYNPLNCVLEKTIQKLIRHETESVSYKIL